MKQEEVSNFLIEERGGHLLSLYLAGSRTNSSRVEDSDWDFFGLVNDDFSQEKEDEINYMLERNFKQEVNFRAIYISELEGGKQKGILTKYIPVEILVKAMPQWEHIDGEKYSQEDFKIKPATPSEEIEFYIGRLKDFRQKAKDSDLPFEFGDYIKTVLMLIGAIQQKEMNMEFAQNYSKILERSEGKRRELARICMDYRRKKNIDRQEFFQKVDRILEKYDD